MAAKHRQGTSASPDGRLEDRLASTVEALRERQLRLARLSDRVRRSRGEHDFVEVVDAAMALDAATAQARSWHAGRSPGADS
jgi:hypothetical protein